MDRMTALKVIGMTASVVSMVTSFIGATATAKFNDMWTQKEIAEAISKQK